VSRLNTKRSADLVREDIHKIMLRDINPSEGGMKQNTFDYMMGHKKLMIYEQM